METAENWKGETSLAHYMQQFHVFMTKASRRGLAHGHRL
jgi:hypothetical protein